MFTKKKAAVLVLVVVFEWNPVFRRGRLGWAGVKAALMQYRSRRSAEGTRPARPKDEGNHVTCGMVIYFDTTLRLVRVCGGERCVSPSVIYCT